jgi:hypothetical protein
MPAAVSGESKPLMDAYLRSCERSAGAAAPGAHTAGPPRASGLINKEAVVREVVHGG